MGESRQTAARRTFLVSVLTGAGAVGALSSVPLDAAAPAAPKPAAAGEPETILYRRTAEAERYYRTLYF